MHEKATYIRSWSNRSLYPPGLMCTYPLKESSDVVVNLLPCDHEICTETTSLINLGK
jgi:hypothetical protein